MITILQAIFSPLNYVGQSAIIYLYGTQFARRGNWCAKAICRAYATLETRGRNGENICSIYARVSCLRRRTEEIISFPRVRAVRWIAGNSTAAGEASCKCDTNWNDVTYAWGTCFSAGDAAREGWPFQYPPWLGSNARLILALGASSRFFKFILANDEVRATSYSPSFIAISCVRSIKIPRYVRIVTCVTSSIVLFSRRIVAIPSAYNPLVGIGAHQWRRPERSAGALPVNAKFRDETKFRGGKKTRNFIYACMQ